MEFHDHPLLIQASKATGARSDKFDYSSEKAFYDSWLTYLEKELHDRGSVWNDSDLASVHVHSSAEAQWVGNGKPYFKLWPGVIPLLSTVCVDVPWSCLKLPFSAFVVRLPVGQEQLTISDAFRVQSILCCRLDGPQMTRDAMCIYIDIGEKDERGFPMAGQCIMAFEDDKTIEQSFKEIPIKHPEYGVGIKTIPDEVRAACLRLVVSACFLSTGCDRLVSPDVLSKDLAAYIEAHKHQDSQRIKAIEERAVRRGKLGFNVGREERFRPIFTQQGDDEGGDPTGRELHFSHQRRAHFRVSGGKVIFVRQCTVRPDLPPTPRQPAYAIR